MGQSINLTLRRVKRFRGMIRDLWDTVERIKMSHKDYLADRKLIQSYREYESLPNWAKEHLGGYDLARYDMIWKKMSFSYVVYGKRITTDSDEWKKVASAGDASEGKHVWTDSPDRIWS